MIAVFSACDYLVWGCKNTRRKGIIAESFSLLRETQNQGYRRSEVGRPVVVGAVREGFLGEERLGRGGN